MLGLFKKKVKIDVYLNYCLDYIFSEKINGLMKNLLDTQNISLSTKEQENYFNHFKGAHLQLIRIVLSRNTKRELQYKALDIQKEFLSRKNALYLNDFERIYSKAFGSSHTDGIAVMSEVIAKEINGETRPYYIAFYYQLNQLMNDFKGMKLVHPSARGKYLKNKEFFSKNNERISKVLQLKIDDTVIHKSRPDVGEGVISKVYSNGTVDAEFPEFPQAELYDGKPFATFTRISSDTLQKI